MQALLCEAPLNKVFIENNLPPIANDDRLRSLFPAVKNHRVSIPGGGIGSNNKDLTEVVNS
jgi:hypothetical protein